jgi:hypothetical protein
VSAGRHSGQAEAVLTLGDAPGVSIAGSGELTEALETLPLLEPGQTASLLRGPKHYIRATRQGDFWSVVIRRGGWWTLGSFTAGMTGEYCERRVREIRAAGSLRKRLALMFRSAPPEEQLSVGQVRTLFTEYLLERNFTIPRSGA